MGYSLCWLAVKGKPGTAVLEVLGLRGTGRHQKIAETRYDGVQLPSGWYIVIEGRGEDLTDRKVLAPLSSACEVVACFVEEHVMVSKATAWSNGKMMWTVTHDGQESIEHLETQGILPPQFASIRDRLAAEQQADGGRDAQVDYIFDIPADLAEALTGYRHDKDIPGLGERPYEVLESTTAGGVGSWIKRLFGG